MNKYLNSTPKHQLTHRISVIIPSYNSYKTIKFSLEELFNQSAFRNIQEIIVVDSSDDILTKELLEEYRKKNKITLIHSGIRVMPGIQRNIGAKHASGDILLFLDSDAYPEKCWAEKILKSFEDGYLAGGGSYVIPDFQKNNKLAKAQYYIEFNEYIDHGKPRYKKILPSCNLYCDRKLFLEIGGFPEIRASEDSLFGLKISKRNPLIFLPDARIYHVFRDREEHFFNNQLLLGKYIFIYRKLYFKSFYYRGILPNILFMIFMLFKFIRIHTRIIFAGKNHLREFYSCFPLFMKGLRMWGNGFKLGIKEYNKDNAVNIEF